MDENQYVLWSASRGGWLTKGAFTTTEFGKADLLSWAEALKICKIHQGGNTMNLMPVDYFLMKEIKG